MMMIFVKKFSTVHSGHQEVAVKNKVIITAYGFKKCVADVNQTWVV